VASTHARVLLFSFFLGGGGGGKIFFVLPVDVFFDYLHARFFWQDDIKWCSP